MADLRPTVGLNPFDSQWNLYEAVSHNVDGTQIVDGTTIAQTAGALGVVAGSIGTGQLANAGPGATGPVGDATHTPVVTIDAKGRVVALSSAAISGGGGGFDYPQSALQYFVDYSNGSDSNTGLGPSDAFQTLQHAYTAAETYAVATYNNLPSGSMLGVGQINLLGGYHDLSGTHVVVTGNHPARWVGNHTGSRVWYAASSQSTIVSGSNLTEFFRIGTNANNSQKGQGHSFQQIAFQVSPTNNASLTKVIWASVCGNFHVENCSFDTTTNATNLTAVAIYQDDLTTSAGEAGWFRIIRNFSAEMALYQTNTSTGAAGGNFNRGLVEGNVCFYGGSYPMVGLYANSTACTFIGNNWEGPAVGLELGANGVHAANLFLNNAGEDQSSSNPGTFYNFSGSVSGCYIIGGSCLSAAASTPGAWVTFGTNAFPNRVYNHEASLTGINARKTKIVNTAPTYPTRNIIEGRDGRLYPFKSGAGAQFTTADWPQVPDDGTLLGITNDTNTGRASIFVSGGGTIHQFVESTVMTLTQRKFAEVSAQTATTAFSPTTTLAAGKLGVIVVASNANKVISSVADTAGNTWGFDHTLTDGTRAISFCSSQIGTNVTSGGTITVTWSAATSSDCCVWLFEIGNAAASSAFDKAADGTGSGTSLVTSATAALSQANEIVIGAFRTTGAVNGYTQGSSYSQAPSFQGTTLTSACCEYKTVLTAAAVTADSTNTHTGTWVASVATYKSA